MATLDIRRTTLSNGIVVLVSENHTNPSVVLRMSVRAAPILDTPEKAGLASLTASGLTRGTTHRSFEEINETVDAAGMSLHSGAGRHLVSVGARSLADDLQLGIDLVADVLRNPTFPKREFEQLKGQTLTSLRQADNDTGAVADRHFRELLYPEGHPYRLRNTGYQETVAPLTRDDLESFHAERYSSRGAFCVVVGDVIAEDVVRRLEESLGGWEASGVAEAQVETPVRPTPSHKDVVVPGKTQADLVLGAVSIRRKDPDFQALRMANMILGRLGMMGRLGETVREEKGLAYGVHSELDAGIGAGPWAVRAGVNPANVEAALAGIRDEMQRLREGGVTPQELDRGKSYSTGSLVLHLETNDGVAGLIQDIELFDLGLDYADRYVGIIEALTLEDVNRVAAKHIPRFEDTVRVVAGPARG
ncbi:MAG TPA: pitrilysin family protein [Chloroflexota bacterium]|nr:pitrilysin family protein [Chloroflexota bacterium]